MEFIDLKGQYRLIEADVHQRIRIVLDHGQYIMGPEVFQLEEKLAQFVGVKHCIGVANGTDALLIALMALGIGVGDEVITTPFSFAATAEVILLLGAKPVFIDINPKTYNLDPNLIEAAITLKTKAIMPVSLYGQCADFDAINTIAKKHHLVVIEDGAQSFGATYKGKRSCSLSTIGCTSFFPSKPLGCYGDGGACFTNDDALAKAMREIHVHGQDRRYHHARLGINGRLDTIQAAILLAKFEIFPKEIELRQGIAARYNELLKMKGVVLPHIEPQNSSVYAQYTIQVENRDAVRKKLAESDIPTAIHYPIPLHHQPAFQSDCICEKADTAAMLVVSLPIGPYLKQQDQSRIVQLLTRL